MERKGFISALVYWSVCHKGRSDQELREGTWRQVLMQRPWSRYCLLASSPCFFAQPSFLCCSGHPLRCDTTPCGVGSLITNQENVPQTTLETFSQLSFPLPSDTSLHQVDIKISHNTFFYLIPLRIHLDHLVPRATGATFTISFIGKMWGGSLPLWSYI